MIGDLGSNSAAPAEPRPILEPLPGFVHQLPQASPPSPALSRGSATGAAGWESISEQEGFYDEQDFLCPGNRLASGNLKNRGEDDVVIFDYSIRPDYLCRVGGDTLIERGGPSSGHISAGDDLFFLVFKNMLIESKEFGQITEASRLMLSRGPRLGIIDFPQCYDTSDENLLNLMVAKLGLSNPTTFGETHSKRVLALPGHEDFRTGISLRVPFKEPLKSSKSGSSEDRSTLFVSFPYFGKSSSNTPLGPEGESVKLLDFKRLGIHVPEHRDVVREEEEDEAEEEGDDIGKILVHQARYMIFDNYTMATFRSKEDSAKDQVPLHSFQERTGAVHAMTHMIANRMDLELWTLGKLQAFLCKLEEDIDQVISDAKTYEDSQGMRGIPADEPLPLKLPLGVVLTEKEELKRKEYCKRVRQNKILKRKQGRVRDLLTSLNRLSAALFAAISVAERQITILQDMSCLFLRSYQTETKDREKRYPLGQNPFNKDIAPTPILAESPGQIWPNTSDTIDEVVRERKSFIKKIKGLVENMDIRRKILFGFLKSDHAKVASSEKTAQEATDAMKRIELAVMASQATLVEQDKALFGFAVIATAFLPLNFCTSYFGMDTTESAEGPITPADFWLTAGPLTISLLVPVILLTTWKRPATAKFNAYVRKRLSRSPKGKTEDIENQDSPAPKPQEQLTNPEPTTNGSSDVSGSLHSSDVVVPP
ncbi:hypothetical protein HOY80DRAFT_1135348 [Tuber brumale]|nr:hypothetical protein HOY80DRAFT_1135348 [Tuber brumale]